MKNVLAVILGGGKGSRLFPLTQDRSKPAVPIGGKYRLIDVPITNCLRSNLNRIFVLTQFNSESLNKHILQSYRFDHFSNGFVNILAAEQTIANNNWYQGTADAVRQNLKHILAFQDIDYVLILSGDQIYNMNYQKLLEFHCAHNFDISLCVKPVNKDEAKSLGIVRVDDYLISDFVEKPDNGDILKQLQSKTIIGKCFPDIKANRNYLASMGIYLFSTATLKEALDNNFTDFGKDIIPNSIKKKKVGAHFFDGYWEDLGTIKNFLQANLDFTLDNSKYNLFTLPLFTHARFLPPSKVDNSNLTNTILAEGCYINQASIKNSVIGIRSIINADVQIDNSIIMGADYYETETIKKENAQKGIKNIGIGKNSIIKKAIVDKNSRIGQNCIISNENNQEFFDGENYYIRNNIIIIPKKSIIADNTVI